MKRILGVTLAVVVVAVLAGAALAHGPGGWGGGMWGGMMGPGMRGGPHSPGAPGCPGFGPGTQAEAITAEKAKEITQQYADQYLKGYAVEQLLPFAGMHMTMYQAELKGPKGETRILHINPWGNVMPFGGPVTR